MTLNNHKKAMYGYRYSSPGNLREEIEQIRETQKQTKQKVRTQKASKFLKKLSFKKEKDRYTDYTEVEFLGI